LTHIPYLKLYRGIHNRPFTVRIQDENEADRNLTNYEVRLKIITQRGNNVLYEAILSATAIDQGLFTWTPKASDLPDVGLYRGSISIQNTGAGLVPIEDLTYNEPYDNFPVVVAESFEQKVQQAEFDGVEVPA
jgi:hypothetical protein